MLNASGVASRNVNKRRNGFLHELKKNKLLFIMVTPAILFFFVFNYLPMGGIILAFKSFNYNQGIFGSPFIGLRNFEFLFQSGIMWRVTRNTILYNVAFIAVDLIVQVSIAIMLSEMTSKFFKKMFQSAMFLPYFVSYILLAAIVYNVFNYEYGLLNSILKAFGMARFDAYNTTGIWKYVLVFLHTWKGMGYGIVIYLAALMGISTEYYEAASIDGASKWQEIFYITFPLLRPTMVIIVLFAVGRIMRGQFELFYQVIGNNGILFETTEIIDTYIFRSLVRNFDAGMGTAAGLYQSFTSFVLLVTVNWVVKKIDPDYALF